MSLIALLPGTECVVIESLVPNTYKIELECRQGKGRLQAFAVYQLEFERKQYNQTRLLDFFDIYPGVVWTMPYVEIAEPESLVVECTGSEVIRCQVTLRPVSSAQKPEPRLLEKDADGNWYLPDENYERFVDHMKRFPLPKPPPPALEGIQIARYRHAVATNQPLTMARRSK